MRQILNIGAFESNSNTMLVADPNYPLGLIRHLSLFPCKQDCRWNGFIECESSEFECDYIRVFGVYADGSGLTPTEICENVHRLHKGWTGVYGGVDIGQHAVGFFPQNTYGDASLLASLYEIKNYDDPMSSLWRDKVWSHIQGPLRCGVMPCGAVAHTYGHGKFNCYYHTNENELIDCIYMILDEH